jgi:hypothetical protein
MVWKSIALLISTLSATLLLNISGVEDTAQMESRVSRTPLTFKDIIVPWSAICKSLLMYQRCLRHRWFGIIVNSALALSETPLTRLQGCLGCTGFFTQISIAVSLVFQFRQRWCHFIDDSGTVNSYSFFNISVNSKLNLKKIYGVMPELI